MPVSWTFSKGCKTRLQVRRCCETNTATFFPRLYALVTEKTPVSFLPFSGCKAFLYRSLLALGTKTFPLFLLEEHACLLSLHGFHVENYKVSSPRTRVCRRATAVVPYAPLHVHCPSPNTTDSHRSRGMPSRRRRSSPDVGSSVGSDLTRRVR